MTTGDLSLNFQRLRRVELSFVGVSDPENTFLRNCDPVENLPLYRAKSRQEREKALLPEALVRVVFAKVDRIERVTG